MSQVPPEIYLDQAFQILEDFSPINLDEMNAVALMKRVDTKYCIKEQAIPKLLKELSNGYRVLEVEGKRISRYRTIYFDSEDYDLYMAHQNGRGTRFKLRYRQYVESDLSFFEIKRKNNKGNTIKKRIVVTNEFGTTLGPQAKQLIREELGVNPDVFTSWLEVDFYRMTLVDYKNEERATIDMQIEYWDGNERKVMENLSIVELKQPRIDRHSTMYRQLRGQLVYPMRMSKYCTGVLSYFENLKSNNFKSRKRKVNSILKE